MMLYNRLLIIMVAEKNVTECVYTDNKGVVRHMSLSEAMGIMLGDNVVQPLLRYITNVGSMLEANDRQNRAIFEYLKAQKEGNTDSIEAAYTHMKALFEKTFGCDCGGTYRFNSTCGVYVCDKCSNHKAGETTEPVTKNRSCKYCNWKVRDENGLWDLPLDESTPAETN